MAELNEWEIAASAQPRPEDVSFDLDKVLSSVVALRTEVPDDAFTAPILGTERAGNGVLIGKNGLVLTIGYLITEAQSVWLFGKGGGAVPGHVVGYDQETGFGLVQALSHLGVPPLELGDSSAVREGDPVIVAAHGGRTRSTKAQVNAVREFAGYWEYVLDAAIFTAPPHPNWGGTGLIGQDGRLLGIGSLFVQETTAGGESSDGNMIIPIDILKPIVDELIRFGSTTKPARPWLGLYAAESEERILIAGLANGGPAQQADIQVGDLIVGVAGAEPQDLVDLFRKIWRLGEAGVVVPLTVWRENATVDVRVRSASRADFLKAPQLH
jgi:S1-C subfamily serine protease